MFAFFRDNLRASLRQQLVHLHTVRRCLRDDYLSRAFHSHFHHLRPLFLYYTAQEYSFILSRHFGSYDFRYLSSTRTFSKILQKYNVVLRLYLYIIYYNTRAASSYSDVSYIIYYNTRAASSYSDVSVTSFPPPRFSKSFAVKI